MDQVKEPIQHARNEKELADIAERLKALSPLPRNGVDVFVRPHKVRRTIPQNDRLWALHNLYAAHMNRTWPERAAAMLARCEAAGIHFGAMERKLLLHRIWDADDVHEEFKKRYLAGGSSRKLSKLAMMDKLSEYEADLQTEESLALGAEEAA